MPDSLSKYTIRTADMTGLIARRSRQSRGDGSDVVTSLGTSSLGSRAAQFSRTASRLRGGRLQADAIRPEGDQRVYRPAPVCRASSARFGHSQALVAAFTDLEHLTVELGRGDVEPSCLQHPAANPDSPLIDQPTGLAARKVEVLGQ